MSTAKADQDLGDAGSNAGVCAGFGDGQLKENKQKESAGPVVYFCLLLLLLLLFTNN